MGFSDDHTAWKQRIAAGDEKAFTTLYHAYSPNIFQVAMMYFKDDTALAEELVQRVFIKVWQKREKLATVEKLEDWLFILARNTILDYLKMEARKLAAKRALGSKAMEEQNDTDHPLLDKEYSRILQNAIDRLPPQQRKVYVMAKQEGVRHEEIARQLSLSKFTIQTHVKLGVRSIQKYVNEHLTEWVVLALVLSKCFHA